MIDAHLPAFSYYSLTPHSWFISWYISTARLCLDNCVVVFGQHFVLAENPALLFSTLPFGCRLQRDESIGRVGEVFPVRWRNVDTSALVSAVSISDRPACSLVTLCYTSLFISPRMSLVFVTLTLFLDFCKFSCCSLRCVRLSFCQLVVTIYCRCPHFLF